MAPSTRSTSDEPIHFNPKHSAYILSKGQATYLRRRNRALYYDLLRDRSVRNNVFRVARRCLKNASIITHVVRNNPQFRAELEHYRVSLTELMDTCSLARCVVAKTEATALDSFTPLMMRPFRHIDLKKFAQRFGVKASECLLHSKNIVVTESDSDPDTDDGMERNRSARMDRHRRACRHRSARKSPRRDRSARMDRCRSPSRRVRRNRTDTTASPSRRVRRNRTDTTASPSRRILHCHRRHEASPYKHCHEVSRSRRMPRSERQERRERRGRKDSTTDDSTDTEVETTTTTTRRTKRRTVVTTTTVENEPSEDSESTTRQASDNESQASSTGGATEGRTYSTDCDVLVSQLDKTTDSFW